LFLEILDEKVSFHDPSIEINNLGLPGKRAVMTWSFFDKKNSQTITSELQEKKFMLDSYYFTPEKFLDRKLLSKNIKGLVITGTKTFKLKNKPAYEKMFQHLMNKIREVQIPQGSYPSCSGCPIGCIASRQGELGGNVLIHSLVSCGYAESIYSDIGIVFSCLNSLGYDYTHEDIELVPRIIDDILKNFY